MVIFRRPSSNHIVLYYLLMIFIRLLSSYLGLHLWLWLASRTQMLERLLVKYHADVVCTFLAGFRATLKRKLFDITAISSFANWATGVHCC